MGTRADFYIGRGKEAEWVCSQAWDGYPDGIASEVFQATTKDAFLAAIEAHVEGRQDITRPADGWPWPWEDSRTTDYSYAFDDGKVWATNFGHGWFDPLLSEPEEDEDAPPAPKVVFPDMTAVKNVTWGKRSGVMLVGANGPVDLP